MDINYYDYSQNINNFTIQNFNINYSHQIQDYNQQYEFSRCYPMPNTSSSLSSVYPQYNVNNEYVPPTQPLTEIYPNNIMYNYQDYGNYCREVNNGYINVYTQPIKINDNMNVKNNSFITSYQDVQNYSTTNYNVNVNSININSKPKVRRQSDSFQSNPDSVIDMDNKPMRKTHDNCTTLFYNRKSSTTSNLGPRKFQCTFMNCFKAYMKNSHLKAHMRIHSGEKPHVCKFVLTDGSVCNEAFSRSDQLTRHRRKHTNDRPFNCSFCNKSFFRSDHCNTHQDRCRDKLKSIFSIGQ